MTKREAMRLTHQEDVLVALGFTPAEAEALRRISMTLHRWSEHECNGTIQRDGDNGDGAPFHYYETRDGRHVKGSRVPDRERGALARLAAIMEHVNLTRGASEAALTSYVQGDPRGACLYILRPGDVPAGEDAGSYYSRGIAVY